jgi:NADH-quinone oxidoreductase subunit A
MIDFFYFYIVYFFFFALVVTFILFFLSYIFAPQYFDFEKTSVYECGFQPFYNSRIPFNVHFYIIAILFLIFDVEIAFLYPWFIVNRYCGLFGLFIFILFIFILFIGFLYEWKKNILEWSKNIF